MSRALWIAVIIISLWTNLSLIAAQNPSAQISIHTSPVISKFTNWNQYHADINIENSSSIDRSDNQGSQILLNNNMSSEYDEAILNQTTLNDTITNKTSDGIKANQPTNSGAASTVINIYNSTVIMNNSTELASSAFDEAAKGIQKIKKHGGEGEPIDNEETEGELPSDPNGF